MKLKYKVDGYYVAIYDNDIDMVTCETCSLSYSCVEAIKLMAKCGIHKLNFDGDEIERA